MSSIGQPQIQLELNAVQRAALEALSGFAARIDQSPNEELSTGEAGGLGWRMVTASSAVVSATLPGCPYAPPGANIDPQWSTGTPPSLVLRCSHRPEAGGPHCWNPSGNATNC